LMSKHHVAVSVWRRSEFKAAFHIISILSLVHLHHVVAADAPGKKGAAADRSAFGNTRLEKIFRALDTDKDGQLSETEFLAGASDQQSGKRDFRLFDLNEDGQLNYEEMLISPDLVPIDQRGPLPDPVVARVQKWQTAIEARGKEWDRNGDGKLGKDEVMVS